MYFVHTKFFRTFLVAMLIFSVSVCSEQSSEHQSFDHKYRAYYRTTQHNWCAALVYKTITMAQDTVHNVSNCAHLPYHALIAFRSQVYEYGALRLFTDEITVLVAHGFLHITVRESCLKLLAHYEALIEQESEALQEMSGRFFHYKLDTALDDITCMLDAIKTADPRLAPCRSRALHKKRSMLLYQEAENMDKLEERVIRVYHQFQCACDQHKKDFDTAMNGCAAVAHVHRVVDYFDLAYSYIKRSLSDLSSRFF